MSARWRCMSRRGRTVGYRLGCGHLMVTGGRTLDRGEWTWCHIDQDWFQVLELEVFDGPPWGLLH